MTGGCVLQEAWHSKVKGRAGAEAGQDKMTSAPGPSGCPWRAVPQRPGQSLELRPGMGAARGVDREASLCPPCPLNSVPPKASQWEAPGGLLPPTTRRPALPGTCFLHDITRQAGAPLGQNLVESQVS